jgi:hypothetical protein
MWRDLSFEFEGAILNRDADWFKRQAEAIKKGGSPRDNRVQFDFKVISLLEQAQGTPSQDKSRQISKMGSC